MALDVLQGYDWPGNVRQLQSVMREMLIVSVGPTIIPEFLPAEVKHEDLTEPERTSDAAPITDEDWIALASLVDEALKSGTTGLYRLALDHFDRLLITRAMQQCSGNQGHTAEILGISRPTLRAKLRSLRLTVQKSITANVTP
jgi:two-component system nitrogen regulation response regulator GlnG